MATTAASRRSGSRPQRRRQAPHDPPHKAAKPAAARTAGRAAKAHKPKSTTGPGVAKTLATSSAAPKAAKTLAKSVGPGPSSMTGKAMLTLAKTVADGALSSRTEAVSELSRDGLRRVTVAADALRSRALDAAATATDVDTTRRPPIQAAVDVAVPCYVAWHEWARLEWLPEGVNGVIKVKRKGDKLTGRLRGDTGGRWTAHVLDERERDSFAWESERGSDCAGLITFHALADRLTRIELSLDVRPLSIAQAAALSTRWADRRAAADLRRFKARLELINPDSYPKPDSDEEGD